MAIHIRRQEFIVTLGGAAAVWPLAARAQISTKRPLVAWLGLGTERGSSGFVDPFLQGMRELGYVQGRDFDMVYRFAEGYSEQLPSLAAEVVRLHPAVILAASSGPALAAKKSTATIPIVTPALADAVHLGLVASEARPGGNVTGIAPYVAGLPAKQMELAREVVPGAAHIGVLATSSDPKSPPQLQELETAGQELGVKLAVANVLTPDDLDGAFEVLAHQHIDVLIVLQTVVLLTERRRIAALTAVPRHLRIPGTRR
jgi:putative ABC transport system substrate-binding protein